MAKTELDLGGITVTAAANLTAHRFVDVTGAVPAAGEYCPGVLAYDTLAGDNAYLVTHGVVIVETGGAIDVGDWVITDNLGRAVAAADLTVNTPDGATPVTSTGADPTMLVTGSELPQKPLGRALVASTDAGQFITIKI